MCDALHAILPMVGLAFMLGTRLGLVRDRPEIADNLARYNAERASTVARWCGAWISLGHGCFVMVVAALRPAVSARYVLPGWMNASGHLVPAAFRLAIRIVNLHAPSRW